MKAHELHTIGYEGLDTQEFLSLLSEYDIQTLVDIRELPLSRKSGFSKNALATSVKRRGIGYIHLPHLGCPKPIRNRYREDGNWTRYQRDFLKYLATQDEAIAALATMAGNSCRPTWRISAPSPAPPRAVSRRYRRCRNATRSTKRG